MITVGGSSDSGNDLDNSFLPDLTTLLDILFILLVFFILTAGAAYRSLDLTLPEAVSDQAPIAAEQKHIMLEIRAKTYALDGTAYSDFEQLKDQLPKLLVEKSDYKLIIAGDRSVSLERLLRVLTYLQAQGIEAANILMQSESQK